MIRANKTMIALPVVLWDRVPDMGAIIEEIDEGYHAMVRFAGGGLSSSNWATINRMKSRAPIETNLRRRSRALRFVLPLLAGILAACGVGNGGKPDHQFNVLLVTLDTIRADRLGSYGEEGGTPNRTPRFDALAADGVRFELAISSAAVTPVSHASILTGLYPYQHGLRVLHAASGFRLDGAIPTLTSTLSEQGWTTGAFLSAFPVSEHFGFDNGFQYFDNGIRNEADNVLEAGTDGRVRWNVAKNQRRSDVTTDQALEWLQKTEGPFFAWVHYWDPHDSMLRPPADLVEREIGSGTDQDDWRRALYDLEVRFVDEQFGRLVDGLKNSGAYDNTIIIVVSDHGEGLGDHDWWTHRVLYQEQIRVPLLIRAPNGARNRVVPSLVRTIDIYPTVLDWLGIEPRGHVEGRSLRPLMDGLPDEPRTAYADQLNLFDSNASMLKRRPNDDLVYCAMDDRWKLIYRPRNPGLSELYHLADDPGELINEYENEPEEVARLLQILEESGGFVDEPFGESVDEEARERLKALGYLN